MRPERNARRRLPQGKSVKWRLPQADGEGEDRGTMAAKPNRSKKPKEVFMPTRQQIIDVFKNSMLYEILFTFGVPPHDPNDYYIWEAINFSRMAHARLLYDFLETSTANRYKDDVLAEDFGCQAKPISLPDDDRKRWNKDLLHFSYDRLRHTRVTKLWPDSILNMLHDPIIAFMEHVQSQADLFPGKNQKRAWQIVIEDMKSGRQLIVAATVDPGNYTKYSLERGRVLASGKAELSKFQKPLFPGARSQFQFLWPSTSNTT
jgi:hypothetical protein